MFKINDEVEVIQNNGYSVHNFLIDKIGFISEIFDDNHYYDGVIFEYGKFRSEDIWIYSQLDLFRK